MILYENTVVKYRDGTVKTLDEVGGEAKELAADVPVKSGSTSKPLDEFIQDQIVLAPETPVVDGEDVTTLEEFVEDAIPSNDWTLAHTWVGPLDSSTGDDASEQDFYFDWNDNLDIKMNIQIQTNQRNSQYNLFFPHHFLNLIKDNTDYPWRDGNSSIYFSLDPYTDALLQMSIQDQSDEQGTVYWYVYTKAAS